MDRLEKVHQIVDEIIRQQPNIEERRCGFVHLYGVASICALLALKRGLDPQICAVAGMLHDIASYKTGDPTNHAQRGALEAEKILQMVGGYTQKEIDKVCQAISKHSAKDEEDEELAELLKDADVIQHYLYNPALPKGPDIHWQKRCNQTLAELAIELRSE